MSQQLTISGLFSTLALVLLALVARAGDISADSADGPFAGTSLIQVEASADLAL